jgi:starch synthase (maltosyl-transferring)
MPLPPGKTPPARIQVQHVDPVLDCGRYPVKRILGEPVEAAATVFRDGHEVLGGVVEYRRSGTRKWMEAPLHALGNDVWSGTFTPNECGRWEFRLTVWVDRWASWRHELERKLQAGQEDLSGELSEGAVLLGRDALTVEEALAAHLDDRSEQTSSLTYEVDVDRELARFGSWYELFPRSWGGFAGVTAVLPRLAELGFDVLYLPPVHPIGITNRKGRNNTLTPGEGDVGSPWAIGAAEGGHDALHPDLGTDEDFDAMIAAAREAGVEIALDFAIQCSPDHPWLKEHPEWFNRRPDGTLKYAENPPKKYQDIYNVNFDSEDWQNLWAALYDVVLLWLIREIRAKHPDVIFLAEAFTRPPMMQTLGKAGFAQSYTYFTWKNTKWELVEFMTQVLSWSDYYRPNFFVNTPDILHEYLQVGGRPAFEARLVLAATLSPSYGIYSGYESFENVPVKEGSEEYMDSEKYEAKERALDGPLLPLVKSLNEVRRAHPALQRVDNLLWLETESEHLIAYAKREADDVVVCVVNLDAAAAHDGLCIVPASLGLPPAFRARDAVSGNTFAWHIGRNYVNLPPGGSHVLAVTR